MGVEGSYPSNKICNINNDRGVEGSYLANKTYKFNNYRVAGIISYK